jgi:hypothetical protein
MKNLETNPNPKVRNQVGCGQLFTWNKLPRLDDIE